MPQYRYPVQKAVSRPETGPELERAARVPRPVASQARARPGEASASCGSAPTPPRAPAGHAAVHQSTAPYVLGLMCSQS